MDADKLYTYQEIAILFSVHPNTVKRWCRFVKKASPTLRTIRVPNSEVQKLRKLHAKNASKTK